MMYGLEFFALLILLLCSAFFSGAEVALISIDKLTLRKLSKQRVKGAGILKELKKKPRKMLVTLLIGNNLVNILISSISTAIALNYFGSIGIGIAVGVATFVILVFGEIFPKTYCEMHNVEIALLVAPIVFTLSKIFYPIVLMFELIPLFLMKHIFHAKPKKKSLSEEDLLALAELSLEENVIQKREKETIEKILQFNDIPVERVMIPIKRMVCLNSNLSVKEALYIFDATGHSRYPVYENKKSNFVGIVHIKEMLRAVKDGEQNSKIKFLMINTISVPRKETIDKTLKKMQKSHLHMAFVANKAGKTIGVVSFEDLIEEIFGEIEDEEDILRSFERAGKL